MIELIAAAVSGAVVGGGAVYAFWRRDVAEWSDTADELEDDRERGWNTLHALRSNCFIPDERGVKVRYSQASVARRVKAEAPKS